MLICFSGTLSVGKTTLINLLKLDDKFKNFKFIEDAARVAQRNGFIINENGDSNTQEYIIELTEQSAKLENAILDGGSLDILCYTLYLYKNNLVKFNTLKKSLKSFYNTINQYNIIFFIEPEFNIFNDGVRSNSIEFQDIINKIFKYIIKKYNIKIYKLTGTVQDRLNQIFKQLNGELNNE